MKIKLGKRKGTPRPHLRRENSSPEILATRSPAKMEIMRESRGQTRKIKDITEDVLSRQVIVDGKPTGHTVVEHILQQRAIEAMQENDDRGIAMAATELLFERAEGKAVSKTEVSGPKGGPIEVVQEHRLLAKLFS